MNTKLRRVLRYGFALLVIAVGIILESLQIGKDFLGFSSVGTWLVYVGFVMLAVITLQMISNRKRIVDERMHLLAYKASRMTFLFVILGAFIVMIIDGIKTITVPYSLFMSYLIAYLMFVYFVTYKILERYY